MVAIVCNNIEYLAISTGQLKSIIDTDDAARGLAKKLGHQIRGDDGRWAERRRKLRDIVLPEGFEVFDKNAGTVKEWRRQRGRATRDFAREAEF